MKKFLDGLFEPKGLNSGLKSLMLNQIYPAVLGSIVYIAFGAVNEQIQILLRHFTMHTIISFESEIAWRFFVLGLTICFYLTDYYYITYTRDYRPLFFFFSSIFLVAMFFTVSSLRFDTNGIGNTTLELNDKGIPEAVFMPGLIIAYLIFIVLYAAWDYREFRTTAREDEKTFYKSVFVWEGLSFVALILNCCCQNEWWFLFTLFGITLAFICLTVWKRKFVNLKG